MIFEGRYFGNFDYQSKSFAIFGWSHRPSATESLNLIRVLLAATPVGTSGILEYFDSLRLRIVEMIGCMGIA